MRLFLYGTLLDPGRFAAIAGSAGPLRAGRPAVLRGARRVVLRGTPWPTLLADGRGTVEGRLVRVGPAALRRLSAYEGRPYRLRPVTVYCRGRAVAALAWIAPSGRAVRNALWVPGRPARRPCAGPRG
ncbi:MAG: gamma-glutamylcyclotransferase [Acetobacteraceae bacterium]|nr:gamma-glutamylcyclotransferase [Acetobacteraceae bacterium]MDW8399916.1 gamma-glutamylcyclotransferase family protein [Acetobacteraceae bacterium]